MPLCGTGMCGGKEDTMATEVYIFIALVTIAIVYGARLAWEALKFRGKMLVTCPETREPAAVKVSLWRAAVKGLIGRKELELCDCSRWPEKRDCDQDCVEQLERDPQTHRVWNVATHWYEGKQCVYCHKPIQRLHHLDRSPALLDDEWKTAEWKHIPAQNLPSEFSRGLPVCWSCHMTETFLREHADLAISRPWEKCGPLGEYVPKNLDEKLDKPSKVA